MENNPTFSKTILKSELLLDTCSMLGEGSIWNYNNQTLYWVDIDGGLLHWFNPVNRQHQTAQFGQKISTVVPTEKGELIVALKDGLYIYQKSTQKLTLLQHNPENSSTSNRFNDGKCDPSGRLWVGTIGNERSASLYRLDNDYSLHNMQTGITNSNGIVWSLDKKTMYYIDTPTQKVIAYTFDNNTGQISNSRDVINIPNNMGSPDGSTIDVEGMIWIALWGGYCVSRWNPKTGELLCKVEIEAKNVTSCAFGGKELDTLYITTSRANLSEDELINFPHSGGVFVVKPGVTGVKANFYKHGE